MLDPRSPGAGLVLLATVTTVYWVGNIAGSAAGETTAVDTNAVLPAPQTQVASAASSDQVFGNQPVRSAPGIPSISRDEQFRQNTAKMDALNNLKEVILTECRFTEYAMPPPQMCIEEIANAANLELLKEQAALIAEEVSELSMPLSDLSKKLTAVQALVGSANTK